MASSYSLVESAFMRFSLSIFVHDCCFNNALWLNKLIRLRNNSALWWVLIISQNGKMMIPFSIMKLNCFVSGGKNHSPDLMLNGIKGGQVIRYEVVLNFSLFAPRTLISSSCFVSFLESEHDVVWVAIFGPRIDTDQNPWKCHNFLLFTVSSTFLCGWCFWEISMPIWYLQSGCEIQVIS